MTKKIGRPRIHFDTEHVCPQCKKTFWAYAAKKFCSNSCRGKALNVGEKQVKAGRAGGKSRIGKGDPSLLLPGGRRSGQGGYVVIQDGKAHEHRVVAEQVLRRTLFKGEVVHHEDLNRANNDPANLIVFKSQATHARHHKLNHLGSLCDCPCLRLGVISDVL